MLFINLLLLSAQILLLLAYVLSSTSEFIVVLFALPMIQIFYTLKQHLGDNPLTANGEFRYRYKKDPYRAAIIVKKNKITYMNQAAIDAKVDESFINHYRTIRPVDIQTSRFLYKEQYFNTSYERLGKTVRIIFYTPTGEKIKDYCKLKVNNINKTNLVKAVERSFTLNSYLFKSLNRKIDIELVNHPIWINMKNEEAIDFLSPLFKIIHQYISQYKDSNLVKINYYERSSLSGVSIKFKKSSAHSILNLVCKSGTNEITARSLLFKTQSKYSEYQPMVYTEKSGVEEVLVFEFLNAPISRKEISTIKSKKSYQEKQEILERKKRLFTA